jgi:hypothetical protein
MNFYRPVAFAAALASAPLAAADPCSEVVADTVAEMRAGAAGGWSADAESLVRAAAGSACVKARSARYPQEAPARPAAAAAQAAGAGPGGDRDAGNAAETVTGKAAADGGAPSSDKTAQGAAGADEERGFSLGGITLRGQSGSPTKKPYERVRQERDEDD